MIRFRTILPILLGAALLTAHAQEPQPHPSPDQQHKGQPNAVSSMQRHYELAYRLQDQGNLPQADVEHTAFLLDALGSIATGYANTGDFAHAAPVYEQALALAPDNFQLVYDYARAAMDASDPGKALALLSPVLAPEAPALTRAQLGSAQKIVAEALYAQGRLPSALNGFLSAAYADPSYENMYSLAVAVLAVKDNTQAKPIFAAILRAYGDSARHRMDLGRAYGQYGYSDDAIQEFQRVLAFDPAFPGAHYSLGAAYLGENGTHLDLAEKEFRKELARNPKDPLCYPQLGRIALARNDHREAELDLRRATELDPNNSSNFLLLGSLYYRLTRMADAESAFRRAIALSLNPEHNNYEIQRAHYQLGRILAARGNQAEAQRELAVSQSLLDRQSQQLQDHGSGTAVPASPLARTRIATPEDAAAFQDFLHRLSPLIAAGYNNLGVHAAMAGQFEIAAKRFGLAAGWNPSLSGVDRNWGRAAFASHDCAQAVAPLERAVQRGPADGELSSMLAACRAAVK